MQEKGDLPPFTPYTASTLEVSIPLKDICDPRTLRTWIRKEMDEEEKENPVQSLRFWEWKNTKEEFKFSLTRIPELITLAT